MPVWTAHPEAWPDVVGKEESYRFNRPRKCSIQKLGSGFKVLIGWSERRGSSLRL